ncbi:MAG: J domain-containing protein [Planctomycetes bacterium]|nr:J domain-containing protein [Planctomycetota bacterium]
MDTSSKRQEERFQAFVRRVWRNDVAPLLRGKRADQRKRAAGIGGSAAAAGGALLDGLFRLKGRPFTRAMTVIGSTIGAMIPDIWDWEWHGKKASEEQRKVVDEKVRTEAARLPEAEALALFDLPENATRAELHHAWLSMSMRWHPDKAPNAERRAEYSLRFVAYQSAYEQLCVAYDEGRLPVSKTGPK